MLLDGGHEVEQVRLPWSPDQPSALRQLAACRWVDLSSADRIICLSPPAHIVPHTGKVIWFARGPVDDAYSSQDALDHPPPSGMKTALAALHAAAVRESRLAFATSDDVSTGLHELAGVTCTVLEAPGPEALSTMIGYLNASRAAPRAPRDADAVLLLGRWQSTIDRLLS
jgi:hypothetical protein